MADEEETETSKQETVHPLNLPETSNKRSKRNSSIKTTQMTILEC